MLKKKKKRIVKNSKKRRLKKRPVLEYAQLMYDRVSQAKACKKLRISHHTGREIEMSQEFKDCIKELKRIDRKIMMDMYSKMKLKVTKLIDSQIDDGFREKRVIIHPNKKKTTVLNERQFHPRDLIALAQVLGIYRPTYEHIHKEEKKPEIDHSKLLQNLINRKKNE